MEKEFNPNDIGIANGNFFGLQQTPQQAAINLLPVTWDATVSYGAGTAQGPEAILEASLQVDLFDPYVPEAWKVNLGTLPFIPELEEMNQQARSCAEQVIAALEEGNDPDPAALQRVNELSEQVNAIVYQQTKAQLEQGKLVGLVGGDHSSPFGAIRAAGEQFGEFGAVESVKAASDILSPVSGEIVEVNEDVIDNPELLNEDAYENWIIKVKVSDLSELDALLSADEYEGECK